MRLASLLKMSPTGSASALPVSLAVPFGLLLLMGACAPPPGEAVATRNLVGGAVYSGKLKHVAVVYVQGFSYPVYQGVASAAGRLVGEVAYSASTFARERVDLTSETSGAVAGQLERRARSKACQYFLEVDDARLLSQFMPDNGSGIAAQLEANRLRSEYEQAIREIGDLRRQIVQLSQSGLPEYDPNKSELEAAQLTALQAQQALQLERLRQAFDQRQRILNNLKTDFDEKLLGIADEPQLISIINPCREFEVGSEVLVINYGFEYVIEERF